MPRVELIYDTDCPNVARARKALLQAFGRAGLAPRWTEWDRKSQERTADRQQYGSPTILVDGRDVATDPGPAHDSDSCRIYDDGAGGLDGAPPVDVIAAALTAGGRPSGSALASGRGWWRLLAAVPAAGAALLPIGLCSACWPAFAGVFGSFGLGFVLDSAFLLPASVGFLGLALFALGFRAKTRRGYGPFVGAGCRACEQGERRFRTGRR